MNYRVGSVCSGYEGLGMAVQAVLGGELTWVADNDPGAAAILAHRFPSVPNLGDIAAADWGAVEPVDVLCAGFPCQDVSCAGGRAGLREGNRTGVWAYVARAIGMLRPPLVVLENVRGLLSFGADSNLEPCPWCMGDGADECALRACGAVLADLADLGFDAEWALVSAADIGAPHRRERVFILAWPTADADRPAGRERRFPAPGQTEGGRPRADACGRGGAPTADAERDGRPGRSPHIAGAADERGKGSWAAAERCGTGSAADASCERLPQQPGSASAEEAGPIAGNEPAGDRGLRPAADWGPYGTAITRWERVLSRPVPGPTEPGRTGERLSPRFVEWMMGLPEGWVTDVPGLSRNAQLKALGNGVVPQQAEMALRLLLGAIEPSGAAA